jgi:nucleotide-binding universal stress UspA family protein
MPSRVTMDRILCPTDYSEFSQRAMRRAVELAGWFGARVTAVHVIPIAPPGLMGTGYGGFVAVSEEVLRAWRDDESRRLGSFVAPFMDAGVPIATELIPGVEGNPWREIKTLAEDLPADLIVMGTHGRTGLHHVLLGSVAEKMLRVAPCPVLTVGAHERESGIGPLFRRVVCATDLTRASGPTVDLALSLAEENLARLTLIHVIQDLHDTSGDVHAHVPGPGDLPRTPIDRAHERLFQLGVPAHSFCSVDERVETGTAWKQILSLAQATHADLIVIGAHKGGASRRLFLGSTANEIVRRAPCPVLVVPEKGATTDERPRAETSAEPSREQAGAARP